MLSRAPLVWLLVLLPVLELVVHQPQPHCLSQLCVSAVLLVLQLPCLLVQLPALPLAVQLLRMRRQAWVHEHGVLVWLQVEHLLQLGLGCLVLLAWQLWQPLAVLLLLMQVLCAQQQVWVLWQLYVYCWLAMA